MNRTWLMKNSKQNSMEEKELAENLQCMRSAIDRTSRDVDPGAAIFIIYALISIHAYTFIYIFM